MLLTNAYVGLSVKKLSTYSHASVKNAGIFADRDAAAQKIDHAADMHRQVDAAFAQYQRGHRRDRRFAVTARDADDRLKLAADLPQQRGTFQHRQAERAAASYSGLPGLIAAE